MLLSIKYYNTFSNRIEIGFIAHEVHDIFPYLVTGDKDGEKIQTLNYTGLIGVLVQEIKDIKKELKETNEKLNKLISNKETETE